MRGVDFLESGVARYGPTVKPVGGGDEVGRGEGGRRVGVKEGRM